MSQGTGMNNILLGITIAGIILSFCVVIAIVPYLFGIYNLQFKTSELVLYIEK
jgi:hypothetical protein